MSDQAELTMAVHLVGNGSPDAARMRALGGKTESGLTSKFRQCGASPK